MSRNQEPPYPSNRSGRLPSREDDSGDDDDDDPYRNDDNDAYGDDLERRPSKQPVRGSDEEEEIDIEDGDVIEWLDDDDVDDVDDVDDDLKQMEGPDA